MRRGFGSAADFHGIRSLLGQEKRLNPFIEWLAATPLSYSIGIAGWIIPTVQIIHILALAILFSSVLIVDLRVMGWAGHGQTLRATLDRFVPWFWAALGVLAFTGLVMIIAEPVRELRSTSFWVKMGVLAIGVSLAIGFLRNVKRDAQRWEEQGADKGTSRLWGIATLVVWSAVILLGRFIAYDNQLWGSLSAL